nr:reverse transcriptase domain-containing protein [Tanacetum cinerariifolium]
MMLKRCEDNNLCLNWEKSHFLVKEGIVLGHKISKNRIEVDKAKVDVIAKLPHPTTVKGIRSFLGHAGFYRRIEVDKAKVDVIAKLPHPTTVKGIRSFLGHAGFYQRKLTEVPILIAPDWDFPFELMGDASDFAIGAVSGQRQEKNFRPIHYASKTMTEAESNYTTTKKEMLAVACHLPIELEHKASKNSLIYKEKTKRLHDSKIKDRVLNIVDRVLLFNSGLKIFSGKLKSRWSGPFNISHVFSYGTVELSQPDRPNFEVNGHRVKHYFGEYIPKMVVPDLQTFPKDQ